MHMQRKTKQFYIPPAARKDKDSTSQTEVKKDSSRDALVDGRQGAGEASSHGQRFRPISAASQASKEKNKPQGEKKHVKLTSRHIRAQTQIVSPFTAPVASEIEAKLTDGLSSGTSVESKVHRSMTPKPDKHTYQKQQFPAYSVSLARSHSVMSFSLSQTDQEEKADADVEKKSKSIPALVLEASPPDFSKGLSGSRSGCGQLGLVACDADVAVVTIDLSDTDGLLKKANSKRVGSESQHLGTQWRSKKEFKVIKLPADRAYCTKFYKAECAIQGTEIFKVMYGILQKRKGKDFSLLSPHVTPFMSLPHLSSRDYLGHESVKGKDLLLKFMKEYKRLNYDTLINEKMRLKFEKKQQAANPDCLSGAHITVCGQDILVMAKSGVPDGKQLSTKITNSLIHTANSLNNGFIRSPDKPSDYFVVCTDFLPDFNKLLNRLGVKLGMKDPGSKQVWKKICAEKLLILFLAHILENFPDAKINSIVNIDFYLYTHGHQYGLGTGNPHVCKPRSEKDCYPKEGKDIPHIYCKKLCEKCNRYWPSYMMALFGMGELAKEREKCKDSDLTSVTDLPASQELKELELQRADSVQFSSPRAVPTPLPMVRNLSAPDSFNVIFPEAGLPEARGKSTDLVIQNRQWRRFICWLDQQAAQQKMRQEGLKPISLTRRSSEPAPPIDRSPNYHSVSKQSFIVQRSCAEEAREDADEVQSLPLVTPLSST